MGNLLGEQHTATCKNHICTIILEAEPIRFKVGDSFLPGTGGWSAVDEEYHNQTPADCPVEGYDWCAINKYALNLKDEYDVHIQTKYQQDMFGYKLFGVEYGNFSVYFFPGQAKINGSIATYNLTSDLKYQIQYLPTRVKDAVIIDRANFFQYVAPADTFDVWYEVTPGFTYNITYGGEGENASDFGKIQVFKDGVKWYEVSHVDVLNGNQELIEQSQLEVETFANVTYFITRINSTNLITETEYPIYIDPQVTVSESASYDAYIFKSERIPIPATSYRRVENPGVHLFAFTSKRPTSYLWYRAVIEFNLSAIPANSTVIEATLNITPKIVSANLINQNVSFRRMIDPHYDYPNTLQGNLNFWEDMGSNFEYTQLLLNSGMVGHAQSVNLLEFNSTNSSEYISDKFGMGAELYGIGMRQTNEPAQPTASGTTSFYPRSSVSVDKRPVLIITYNEPTENWRYAILLGIVGISGFMMYVSRKMSSEYTAIKLLLMLSSILFGLGAVAVSMIASQSLNGNIEGIIITMFTATTYLLLTVVAFSIMKLLNTTFNILKGRKS
ncbi:MAG: hypothetical protein ACTSPU_00045 [Promethearchaeota archaeon]